MNQKVLQTLEYDKVKQMLSPYLVTENGQKELNQLQPSSNMEQVQNGLDESDDGSHIFRLNKLIPIPKLADISADMKRLAVGADLNGTELAQVNAILSASSRVKDFFGDLEENKVDLKVLYSKIEGLNDLPDVAKRLKLSVDTDGKVLDSASAKLQHIRHQLRSLQGRIKTQMNSYINGKQSKYLSEAIITVRDGRYVIPVKAEYKQKFGGIVHDQSTSGLTLYIEPEAVVSLNNDLRSAQIDEMNEIKEILVELSAAIRPYQAELMANAQQLGHLDLINAKAKFADSMHATKPSLSPKNEVNLKKARHPLITQSKVVGNTIELGKEYRQIIITGPNTGGKTITIKTLGINQLLAQSGLFILADEGSQVGVFDNVFADIGDDQSIEANLSTFSSHIDNLIDILKQVTDKSLVLIDELGAGTDPREGAALAMSILDKIGEIGSEVLATTHYPELKVYGYNRPETENASMEFDEETLEPTYRLLMGVPGQSNALKIAKRLGMDESIIDEATALNGDDSEDINHMIDELARQTKAADERARSLKQKLEETDRLQAELDEELGKYNENKTRLLDKAKRDANQIVARTKRQANDIIDDLHQKQTQTNHAVKENELIDAKGKLNALEQHPELSGNKVLKRQKQKAALKVGDEVLVKTYVQRGVIVKKLDKGNFEVQLGILKMKVNEANLEKVKPTREKVKEHASVSRSRSSSTTPTLDLRGHRYDEAMVELDRYIDAALVAGYPAVTIVHGKGTGVLREGVTKYLKRNKRVKEFGFSPANAGGNGSTYVKFK